jgi:hypothetical protein
LGQQQISKALSTILCRFVPFLGQHSPLYPLFQPNFYTFQGSTGLKLGFLSPISGQQQFLGDFYPLHHQHPPLLVI